MPWGTKHGASADKAICWGASASSVSLVSVSSCSDEPLLRKEAVLVPSPSDSVELSSCPVQLFFTPSKPRPGGASKGRCRPGGGSRPGGGLKPTGNTRPSGDAERAESWVRVVAILTASL